MTLELLYKIADLINQNSNMYHAVIPIEEEDYMRQVGDHLVKSKCRILQVTYNGKVRSRKVRTVWNIYAPDIEKVITKIGRRDLEFAKRIDTCEPTLFDIEIVIRRASMQSLKLKLVTTSFDLYLSNP